MSIPFVVLFSESNHILQSVRRCSNRERSVWTLVCLYCDMRTEVASERIAVIAVFWVTGARIGREFTRIGTDLRGFVLGYCGVPDGAPPPRRHCERASCPTAMVA